MLIVQHTLLSPLNPPVVWIITISHSSQAPANLGTSIPHQRIGERDKAGTIKKLFIFLQTYSNNIS